MKPKEYATLILFLVFTVPTLLSVSALATDNADGDMDVERTGEVLQQAIIPWWIGTFVWLAGLGLIGVLFMIGVVWVLNELEK